MVGGLGALALIGASWAGEDAREAHLELGLGGGYVAAPFRDEQVSSRRQDVTGGGLFLSLDTLGAPRLDRAELQLLAGGEGGWSWLGLQTRATLAPDVLELGPITLRIGGQLDGGVARRRWLDALTWRAQLAVGPAVAVAIPIVEDRWTVDVVASTPLIGILARPGWAGPVQGFGLSTRELRFASLHNHRGGQLQGSLLWQRPGRASLRLQGELTGRVITWRHRLAEVGHSVSLLLYWRL